MLVVVVDGQILVDRQKLVIVFRPTAVQRLITELVELFERAQRQLPMVRDELIVDQGVMCQAVLAQRSVEIGRCQAFLADLAPADRTERPSVQDLAELHLTSEAVQIRFTLFGRHADE